MLKRFVICLLTLLVFSTPFIFADQKVTLSWDVEVNSISGEYNYCLYWIGANSERHNVSSGYSNNSEISHTEYYWHTIDPIYLGAEASCSWNSYYYSDSDTGTMYDLDVDLELFLGVEEDEPDDPPQN
ncbi:MAG: hypothetical protein KGY75_10860 [Candidatus Cloacimonetes bacterium]|nr:hypothetical protein [Candidatus Cloacimonadota bacterium]